MTWECLILKIIIYLATFPNAVAGQLQVSLNIWLYIVHKFTQDRIRQDHLKFRDKEFCSSLVSVWLCTILIFHYWLLLCFINCSSSFQKLNYWSDVKIKNFGFWVTRWFMALNNIILLNLKCCAKGVFVTVLIGSLHLIQWFSAFYIRSFVVGKQDQKGNKYCPSLLSRKIIKL